MRRLGQISLGIGIAVFTVSAIAAQDKPAPPPPPRVAQPPFTKDGPGAIVAARKAVFLLSGATFGSMKGAIDRGDDVKAQQFAARAIARWARTLPGMFPAGTDLPTSDALPNVWSDRAGLEAKAADYEAAALKLAELAGAGDKAGFAAQWMATRKTCSACHDVYRKPNQRPGG